MTPALMARLRAPAMVVAVLLTPVTAGAQDPDEQTQDHEDQDRRYYEQQVKKQQEPSNDAASEKPEPTGAPLADEFIALAEELIKDRNYWGRNSDRYMVETDDPELDTKAVLELLDSFRAFFDAFWEPRLELRPYETQSRVFLYDSFYKYNQLLGFDARRMPVRPEGHYISAFNVLVVQTRAGPPSSFADAIVHEAAHQLIDQRIYGGSNLASVWVGEGLASYFGYTLRTKSGQFEAGRTGGKSISLFKDAGTGSSNEAGQRLKSLRGALKIAESGWLEGMLSADPQRFYGGNIELNYAAAWLVVHYLLHADDGSHAEAFASYLESEAAGNGGPQVLYEALGTTAAELESAVTAYAGKVKTG